MNIENINHEGQQVEAVHVDSIETLREIRESDWHDGALSLLTYPSTVVGYIGYEPPKAFGGHRVEVGDTIVKGPAGDFDVIRGQAA